MNRIDCIMPLLDGFPSEELTSGLDLTDGAFDVGELYVVSIFSAMQLIFGEAGFTTSVAGRLIETAALAFGGLVVSLVYANTTADAKHFLANYGKKD